MNIAQHTKKIKQSYIREILEHARQDGCISLAGGLPSPESFPMAIFDDAFKSLDMDHSVFQYATTSGEQALLEAIAQRYPGDQDRSIMITTGSQQGIDLCARAFINAGDKVVLEQPSYLGALQCFALAQASMCFVHQECDGPDIEQLEHLFQADNIAFFYAVPDFHNPTGVSWSVEKRQAVAQLCRQYHVLLIEDAPYRELRFSGEELPSMASYLPEQTIELRSLSKILAPGLRVSALMSPSQWRVDLLKVKQATDLHSNVFAQRMAALVLNDVRFSAHLEAVRALYRQRYQSMAADLKALQEYHCHHAMVEGGMFIWLNLPPCDVTSLAAQALESGVAVVPGDEFYVQPPAQASLRLNFSYNFPAINTEGLTRLIPLIQDALS